MRPHAIGRSTLLLTAIGVFIFQIGCWNDHDLEVENCSPEADVRLVAEQVPQLFTAVLDHEYVVDYVAGSRNGFPYGGQLRVLFLCTDQDWRCGDSASMIITDRRASDPTEWYMVANGDFWDSAEEIGCVTFPARPLTLAPVPEPTLEESQERFNELVSQMVEAIHSRQAAEPAKVQSPLQSASR